jgi:hypothetical protein
VRLAGGEEEGMTYSYHYEQSVIQHKIHLPYFIKEYLVPLPNADILFRPIKEDDPPKYQPTIVAVYSHPKQVAPETFEYEFIGVRVK